MPLPQGLRNFRGSGILPRLSTQYESKHQNKKARANCRPGLNQSFILLVRVPTRRSNSVAVFFPAPVVTMTVSMLLPVIQIQVVESVPVLPTRITIATVHKPLAKAAIFPHPARRSVIAVMRDIDIMYDPGSMIDLVRLCGGRKGQQNSQTKYDRERQMFPEVVRYCVHSRLLF